ncbi:hypothetical protein O9929_03630 [Vibrio lentus]|nr:hypothetical protein [Vibrio lentus]
MDFQTLKRGDKRIAMLMSRLCSIGSLAGVYGIRIGLVMEGRKTLSSAFLAEDLFSLFGGFIGIGPAINSGCEVSTVESFSSW